MNNEELTNLFNIIVVMKSRRMRLADHIASMREIRNAHAVLIRNPEEQKDPLRSRGHMKTTKLSVKNDGKI